MAAHKRVVRSDLWIDRAFDERLAREPDISLQVCAVNGLPASAWDQLGTAANPSPVTRRTDRPSASAM